MSKITLPRFITHLRRHHQSQPAARPQAKPRAFSVPLVVAILSFLLLLSLALIIGLPGDQPWAQAKPLAGPFSAATSSSTLPGYENLPPSGETYPGSGTYPADTSPVMAAAVEGDQEGMSGKGIDVPRLAGLRQGDVLFKLNNGQGKRATFYERGAYHELDGQVALGSLVLTVLKDGKIVLGTSSGDFYQLSQTQQDYLQNQSVTGEGGQSALAFGDLLRAGTFDGLPILNTDPSKAQGVLDKYEGKLVTRGFAGSIDVRELADPNFHQEMLPVDPATGMRMPKSAHEALLRIFNDDESALVKLVGLPVSPYFVVETGVKGQLKKIGVLFTERQVLTYNPDNDAANRWEIGLFGARLYDTVKSVRIGPPTATATPLPPTPTATPEPPGPALWPSTDGHWYPYEGAGIPHFPGVYLNIPLHDNQKAVFTDAVTGPQRVWTGFLQSIAVQGPTQHNPDGTHNVLDTPDKVVEQLRKYGTMTYSIPVPIGSISDRYGGHARLGAREVTFEIKNGLQIYFASHVAPGQEPIKGGGSGVYQSVGPGIFVIHFNNPTSAEVNILSLFTMNEYIAWVMRTRDPSFDLYDAVRLSTWPDQPKAIDSTLYFQYTGPDSFKTDLIKGVPR